MPLEVALHTFLYKSFLRPHVKQHSTRHSHNVEANCLIVKMKDDSAYIFSQYMTKTQ